MWVVTASSFQMFLLGMTYESFQSLQALKAMQQTGVL
jgi:hypothetical protein